MLLEQRNSHTSGLNGPETMRRQTFYKPTEYTTKSSGYNSSYPSLLRSTLSWGQPFLPPSQLQSRQPHHHSLFAMGNGFPPKVQPPLLPTITTALPSTTAATPKAPSRLDLIKESYKVSEKSEYFKEAAKQNFHHIYHPRLQTVEKPSSESYQDWQIEAKLSHLENVKNENSGFQSRIKKWLSFDKPSFVSIRKFIPFLRNDYQVSDEAQVDHPKEEALPVWTREMEMEVQTILNSPANTHLVTAFSINIHTRDIQTLHGRSWLNDAVMEFYFNLITERASKNTKYPSVYTFGTFFYTRLERGQPLGRWARKLDFFSYDLLIMPIIYSSHWRLVVVNNKERKIEYYDSLGNTFNACVNAIVGFLQAESREKRNVELDMSEWKIIHRVPGIPLQNNSYDCGVFACKYAEYIARRAPISFTQTDIPFFRRCMMYEIVHRELLIH